MKQILAWIDLVVRPGRTFRYSDGGVLGLVFEVYL
jgi:FMN-dependent NADH-azoreductase